jgi:phosphoadenosine phosphosulfate reductase
MTNMRQSIRLLKEAVDEFGDHAFATSSFQSQSLPLLYLIALFTPDLPVWFLDTGFHFPETLAYRDQIVRLLGLNLVVLEPGEAEFMRAEELLAKGDTDGCCALMKVAPMEKVLRMSSQSCWISGVRQVQTKARRLMADRESAPHGITRVHPIVWWSDDDVDQFLLDHPFPRHPLFKQGYESIGCSPCTVPGVGRSGRWKGQAKDGCGIHGLISRETCGSGTVESDV